MSNVNQQAQIVLDKEDMAAILTEEFCCYNAFGNLKVDTVLATEGGTFTLYLSPKVSAEAEHA